MVSFADVAQVLLGAAPSLFWFDWCVVVVCMARLIKLRVQSDVIGGITLSIGSVGSWVFVGTFFPGGCSVLEETHLVTLLGVCLCWSTVPASYIPAVSRAGVIAMRVCVGSGIWR